MTGRRWNVDPALIRRALLHSDTHSREATGVRFGVAPSTVGRWRQERADAAASGRVWPSDADLEAFRRRVPVRARARVTRVRWQVRTAATGPMLVDGTGTQRRLRALAAIGWRYLDVAERIGATPARIGHLAVGLYPKVHRDVTAAVARVYDELSMRPGPSARTRGHALRHGWAPPLCWEDEALDDPKARPRMGHRRTADPLDEIAIERAMAGDDVHLTPRERAEAARRLTGRGLSAAEVADRLRTTKRSVVRYRSAAA